MSTCRTPRCRSRVPDRRSRTRSRPPRAPIRVRPASPSPSERCRHLASGGASGRAPNVTRISLIFPSCTRLHFAVGLGGATVVCRSNHVRTSGPSTKTWWTDDLRHAPQALQAGVSVVGAAERPAKAGVVGQHRAPREVVALPGREVRWRQGCADRRTSASSSARGPLGLPVPPGASTGRRRAERGVGEPRGMDAREGRQRARPVSLGARPHPRPARAVRSRHRSAAMTRDQRARHRQGRRRVPSMRRMGRATRSIAIRRSVCTASTKVALPPSARTTASMAARPPGVVAR